LKKRIFYIFTCSIIITACSNKQLYLNGQRNQQNDCINNSVSDSQYMECLDKPKKSYEQYEKDRKKLIENKDQK